MSDIRLQSRDTGDLAARYRRFIEAPIVRDFQRGGGQVFIATEHQPAQVIDILIRQGHRRFAEKFVQEVASKWSTVAGPPSDLVLHGFGRLQTNKAKAALAMFDALEALDRVKLASVLARHRRPGTRVARFYIQVNTGGEPQKGGVLPEELERLFQIVRDEYGLPIAGLMAIPPRDEEPERHFKWLRASADRLRLPECIMGMTNDYAQAINCGSTAIRIGRAILG